MTFSHRCRWRLRPVDWWRVTDVSVKQCLHLGLLARTFRWNTVPSSWAVGPEDESKLISRQGETSQVIWIFTNTAVRISQPPTLVPKRRQETTNRHCVKSQKSADLIYTVFKARSRLSGNITFSAISMRWECTDWGWHGVSLLCCSHVWWSFQI
jgi:hypothetical protein